MTNLKRASRCLGRITWTPVLMKKSQKFDIVDERLYRSYLRRERPEQKHINEYLRRRLESIPIEVCQNKEMTLKKLVVRNSPPSIDSAIPQRRIKSLVHIKDLNGDSLLIKVNTGADEVFESTETPPIHKYLLDAMDRLNSRGVPAPPPANIDNRYPTNNFRITKRYWTSKDKPCGVFHFACWRMKGHVHNLFA
ncbi:hypothetical protein G7Y89_g14757 [Cudoniella acicularis]|uniref:Uncharacterized protein n=1 Tax=Cudoniella acicularis TaxID=354080 RepID=A0A8H4VQF7_9HELO|nr:hypothetical protein G7Y89_g14757 [Cudoniella acicularis]